MSFSKINQLRHEGKLKEALEQARADRERNPDNLWNKRALGWVYHDLLKNATERNLPDKVVRLLNFIREVNLPAEEKIFFESIGWTIAKYLNRIKNLPPAMADKILAEMKSFSFPKPSASFTFLVKSVFKCCESPQSVNDVIPWLNPENFREEDFQKKELENGKKILSDVEQIYIAASKLWLKEPVNRERITGFLPLIEQLTQSYPDMQYPHYYYARLLLATGNKQHFLKAFIPFARKKKRDFWVWDLLSEIFDKDDPRYFACLCRSLACGAPVKFSLNVKEKFADALIGRNMPAEARYEMDEVINCRNREGWKLTPRLQKWMKDDNLKTVKPAASNQKLYMKYTPDAEKLLYYDMAPETIVVEKVNGEKKVVYFVAHGPKRGSFLYRNFNITPRPGDILMVRFLQKGNDKSPNFYKVATLEPSDEQPPASIFKTVKGTVKIKQGTSYGFVRNVFVPPDVVSGYKLSDGQTLKLNAVLSFNKKKKQWDWKAISINSPNLS